MKIGKYACVLTAALLCGVGLGMGPLTESQVERQVRPLIDAEIAPGVSVTVYKNGGVQSFGFGSDTFGGEGKAPDEHTIYEVGSITKVFTGLLLAEAVRRGEAGLDDPLSEHLPEGVRAPERDGKELTLVQLATHSSSLPRMPSNIAPTDPLDPFNGYTPKSLWRFIGSWRPERAPGSEYEYSNLGMGLLGQLLADEAGMDYATLVQTRICEPLGLEDTRIEPTEAQRSRVATGHLEGKPTPPWHFDALAGCGALHSTTSDLMKFLRANMDPPKGALAESINASHEPHFTMPDGQKVALAWHIARDGSTYWHNGQTYGCSGYMCYNKAFDSAVVVLANGSCEEIAQVGVNILFQLGGADPDPIKMDVPAKVAPEQLERLVGVYQSQVGFAITITRDERRLYAAVTGQGPLRVYPESPTLFKYRAVKAELEFQLDDEAEHAKTLTLFQNGMEFVCTRKE
ncbi:MAG: serine hydrolase [Phycisphaerales bacterium]